MKKLLILSLVTLAISLKAQTNTIPSFVETAGSYFTSFNTNLVTFSNGIDHVDITTGTENWNNKVLLANFHGDMKVYSVSADTSLRAVATFYNDTTLGSLSKADAGIGLAYVIWDTKVTGSLNGGYDWSAKAGYIRPDLKFEKAMTQHTFAGINLGIPIYFKGQADLTPNYGVDAGFNF